MICAMSGGPGLQGNEREWMPLRTEAKRVPSGRPGAVCGNCGPPRRERKFDRGSTLGVDGIPAKILNEVRRYRPGMNYCTHIFKGTTSA